MSTKLEAMQLEALKHQLLLLYHNVNGAFSTIHHLHKEMPIEEAAAYFQRWQESIERNMTNARMAFNNARAITGPED